MVFNLDVLWFDICCGDCLYVYVSCVCAADNVYIMFVEALLSKHMPSCQDTHPRLDLYLHHTLRPNRK